MAPDLNAVAGGDKFDYSKPGSSGYNVDQNYTWMDPNNRKLRVLTIGALIQVVAKPTYGGWVARGARTTL